ncbi:hypothetical protein V7S43_009979 [Phytophthora oleae]|uniref:Uncharacterized protein n=1 Tax=Phytophthora oleae TaxID=2107226 RepID=A0ABD3FER1_9STRA
MLGLLRHKTVFLVTHNPDIIARKTLMVSPERMQEHIDIEQEVPARVTMVDQCLLEWPSTGAVSFDKVSFRLK